jgi:hypothetical protein
MNLEKLNILINLPELIFEPEHWDEGKLLKLDFSLDKLESEIFQEIMNNLFGKNFIEKDDIIKLYLEQIADVSYRILSLDFDDADEDEINKNVLEKIKASYQSVINFICTTSIRNDINIIKISQINKYISYLDLTYYFDELKELNLEKGTNKEKLKSEFSSTDSYELFIFIVDYFDKSYSDHNKFSCIYRMMIKDGFIDENLKPEHFRRLIISEHKATIEFFLLTIDTLSKKIIKHYHSLKSDYLNKNS